MTSNQLNYQRNLELERNNKVTEHETRRSNLAREQETQRNNLATEYNSRKKIEYDYELGKESNAEQGRHNRATEQNQIYVADSGLTGVKYSADRSKEATVKAAQISAKASGKAAKTNAAATKYAANAAASASRYASDTSAKTAESQNEAAWDRTLAQIISNERIAEDRNLTDKEVARANNAAAAARNMLSQVMENGRLSSKQKAELKKLDKQLEQEQKKLKEDKRNNVYNNILDTIDQAGKTIGKLSGIGTILKFMGG